MITRVAFKFPVQWLRYNCMF